MADNVKSDKKVKVSEKDKKGKPGIGKRLSLFFSNLKAELKRVVWPDRKKLIHSTMTVIAIALTAGILLFVLDSLLGAILEGVGFYDVTTPTTVSTTVATTEGTTVPTTTAETTASAATTAATSG